MKSTKWVVHSENGRKGKSPGSRQSKYSFEKTLLLLHLVEGLDGMKERW